MKRMLMSLAVFTTAAWHAPLALAQGGPPSVIVETAALTEFVDAIEAIGTLRAAETVQISATVTERVSQIGFDDGQRVVRDQILVEFEAREENARIREAKTAVEIAQREYERAERLLSTNTLSESAYLVRQRDLAVAQAQLESASAQISDRVIRAPFDGVVGLRTISVGATVTPGDPIVRIDDISNLNLDFPVPATRLTALQPGQTIVAIASALGGEPFRGAITTIDSFVDPATRSVMVRAAIPNPQGRLRPGLLMTVDVKSAPRRSVTVNEAALIPFGAQLSVYVVRDDGDGAVVEQRAVQTGARRAGEVEILAGLETGEAVITHGAMKVRPGSSVTPIIADGDDSSALAQYLDQTGG